MRFLRDILYLCFPFSFYSQDFTSTPLRSVELSKEWQRFRDQGKSVTLSLLCQTFPHFHTSKKCETK